jgi:glycerol-3-phosphate O-acyltransferase
MGFIGKALNKLFVSAKVIGGEHLRIGGEVIYVLENDRAEHRALLALTLRHQGVEISKRCLLSIDPKSAKTLTYRLESLIEKLEFSDSDCDVRIIPVTILHGHFPNRESSLWRIIFSERWGFKGWWGRLMQLVVNGRQTLLQLDSPLSLRRMVQEQPQQTSGAGAIWVMDKLQDHFVQRRNAIYGPKLLNRKQLMSSILASDEIQRQVFHYSEKNDLSIERSQKYAKQQLNAIATNISPSFVRLGTLVLSRFFERIYRQIKVLGIDKVRQVAKDYQVVFLPCHRSHMDYVLMTWNLHNQGIVIPHIVAGDNLNAPILGSGLKRGGAIFMRRSFYDDPLYGELFKSYISQLHKNGNALEYFIEGGRSRTGRLLPPKVGVLSMTLEASLQENAKPIALIPVWVSYDKIVEAKSYSKLLGDEQKKPESLLGLLNTLKVFKSHFGDAVVSYGEPVLLDNMSKFDNLKSKGQFVARSVMERIAAASYVNESALLATALLSQPRLRLTKEQLIDRVNRLSSVLVKMPNAPAGIAKGSVEQWIEDARLRGQVSVSSADVYLTAEQAREMTFYRNQVHHLTLFVGLYLLVAKRYPKPKLQTVHKLIKAVYPYLAKELYWSWQGADVNKALGQVRELLVDQQLVVEESRNLLVRNTAVSVTLMQTAESYLLRYYIVFRLLQEYSDLPLSGLIDESVRLAKMLHAEFGFHSPEYTDSQGIANFIKSMHELEILMIGEGGAVVTQVDASALMQRSKQILLPHYVSLIDKDISKH